MENDNPRGKDASGHINFPMPEPQEKYEEEGGKIDVKDGNFTQDPFTLKASEEDHTPNFKGKEKPNYGHFDGSQKDGMELKGGYRDSKTAY